MRSFFIAGLVVAGILFGAKPVQAQADSVSTRLVHLKISPQHLFINALNLELENRFAAGGKHSLTVSPRYYAGKSKTIDKLSARESGNNVSTASGYGLEIMHRLYQKNPLIKNGEQYFAYGFNYHHFNLTYESLGWAEVLAPDGLKYFLYQWHKGEEKIDRYGLVAIIGVQDSYLNNRLVSDFYGGLGYRFSNTSNPDSERFTQNILDYGSTGMYLTVGVKLGYSF